MTDERLRELEQRWKASGSTEDEAAYLLERMRVGDLEPLAEFELEAAFELPSRGLFLMGQIRKGTILIGMSIVLPISPRPCLARVERLEIASHVDGRDSVALGIGEPAPVLAARLEPLIGQTLELVAS